MKSWIDSPELVRHSASWRPIHCANHDEWFKNLLASQDRVFFAVRTIADELIGVVQLVDIHPVYRNAEMIIRIGSVAHQSKGYGTEALGLLLDFARRDLNLHRVWARVFSTNKRALRSYEKAGFTLEGQMRDAAFIDGAWVNILIVGAIVDE